MFLARATAPERLRVVASWGFALPCAFYLLVGLALYPQLGFVADALGVPLAGAPAVPEWILMSAAFAAVGVTGVVVHEFGHALWIAARLGGRATIRLGLSTGVRHNLDPDGDYRMVALCGPVLQAAYGIAVLAVAAAAGALFFALIGAYSICDAVYNLIPLRGHDGAHVFRRGRRADESGRTHLSDGVRPPGGGAV